MVTKTKTNRKSIRGSGIWVFFLLAVLVFVFFQLINPIEANAPSDAIEASVTPVSKEQNSSTNQDLTDGVAEASVLMYHHIGPLPNENDKIRYGLTVSEEDFDAQIKYIEESGYNVMTLGQLEVAIASKKLPEKTVVLTFDDGYDDNFVYAKPILEKYGFSGTFFIISSKIGQPEYMSEDQVKELAKNHEIGSHSYSHPSMARLSDYYLEREMKQSKDDLESLVGRKIVSFCYPAGKYDDKAVEKLKEYGYKIAVTTEASTGSFNIDNLLLVPRYRIAPAMSLEALLR